jgi:hypothetical protein
MCPPRGAAYDVRGFRIGGPPSRASDRSYTLIRHGQNASNDSLERRSAPSVDLFASGLRDERERGSLTIGP